jgi:hypothetical protein
VHHEDIDVPTKKKPGRKMSKEERKKGRMMSSSKRRESNR